MNAIIAAATGYSETALEPFLASIHRVCPGTQLFLIVFGRDRRRMDVLRARYPFIEPVYVRTRPNRGSKYYSWLPQWIARHLIGSTYEQCHPVWKHVGRYSLHIALERYFTALEIVRGHRESLTNVLLTDSRDVVLQHDPFGRLDGRLVSGIEAGTIGRCPVNSAWLTHVYGADALASMSEYRVVCSGVTIGPVEPMYQYLAQMCKEIWRCLPRVAGCPYYDQSIHNYLIYATRVLSPELTENGAGMIATLHTEEPASIRTDEATGLVTVGGKVPAILHQYDRLPSVTAFVRETLCETMQATA